MLELARECDWEAVQRLSVQVHDLHVAWRPDIFYSCDAPYPKEFFLEDMANRLVYVAKLQDQVVGYVVLSMEVKGGHGTAQKRVLSIDSICVDEAFRRQGIGRQMLADVRALARAFRCREVLLSVHPENDVAVVFYQKCGFRIRTIKMDMPL